MVGMFDANQQQIDPTLYDRQAAGAIAREKAKAMQGGPAIANALRRSQEPLPNMLGRGASSVAASPLNVLGTLMQRSKGNRELEQMEAQASALRGESEDGLRAKFMAEQQGAQIKRAQELQDANTAKKTAQENVRLQAALQAENAMARDQAKIEDAQAKRESFTATTPEGTDLTLEKDDYGNWYKDGELLEDHSRYLEMNKKAGGKTGIWKLGRGPQDKVITARQNIIKLGKVQDLSAELGMDDKDQLAQIFKDTTTNAFTPDEWKEYWRQNQREWSPKLKDYMLAVDHFDTDIRHEMYGATLTKGELSQAAKILAGQEGISYSDRQRRIRAYLENQLSNIKGIDPAGELNLLHGLEIPNVNVPDEVDESDYESYMTPEDAAEMRRLDAEVGDL